VRQLLPAEWTGDPARCRAAGVPEERLACRTKSAIALEGLDRLLAAGVSFGYVLADTGYGASAEFRKALSARGLTWAEGIARTQRVYAADVEVRVPRPRVGAHHGRPRKHPVPTREHASAEDVLAARHWSGSPSATGPRGRSRRASPPCVCAWLTGPRRCAPITSLVSRTGGRSSGSGCSPARRRHLVCPPPPR
jgi:DDE superfamily endonuclease